MPFCFFPIKTPTLSICIANKKQQFRSQGKINMQIVAGRWVARPLLGPGLTQVTVHSCCAPLCFCAIRRIPLATYLVSCGLTCLSRSHKEGDSYSPAAKMRQVEISCLVYGELWVVDEVKTMPLAARPHSPAWLVVWQYARLGNTTQQQSLTCLTLGFVWGPIPHYHKLISDN